APGVIFPSRFPAELSWVPSSRRCVPIDPQGAGHTMKLTSPKNTRRTAREKSPTREPVRPDHPGLGKRGLPRWLLLVLFAAGSFGVTYALVTWSGRPAAMPPREMVWIPGGEFTMGTDADSGLADEKPAHRVRVAGFWMDPTEVTNAQFRA